MFVNESNSLATRRNNLIFIYKQSVPEKLTSRVVKPENGISNLVNLPKGT